MTYLPRGGSYYVGTRFFLVYCFMGQAAALGDFHFDLFSLAGCTGRMCGPVDRDADSRPNDGFQFIFRSCMDSQRGTLFFIALRCGCATTRACFLLLRV